VKFKSAVDWWYYIVIIFIACSLLFSLLPQVQSGEVSAFYGGSIALLALGVPVWLLFSTYYKVEGDRLTIRSGPFAWHMAVSEIESTKPSRSMLSAPALSLKRIELTYKQGQRICISPKDSQAFLKAIGHAS
jgi:hypothetical protein